MGRYDPAARRPDVLALSTYTPGARRAYALAAEARATASGDGRPIRVIAGGHHATALPLEAIEHCDAVVRGETTPALLQSVLRWAIGQMETGGAERRVFELAPFARGSILHARPIANRTWYDASRYYMSNGLQTSLGCPFACPFCATTFSEGAQFRTVDYGELDGEAATLRRGGITAIIDDNLLPAPDGAHARRVCEVLRRHRVQWQAELTALTLHANMRELVPLFARSGCRVLFFGFETIRGGMRKSADLARYAELIRCCHDHGIAVIGAFVFGIHEDEDDGIFAETVDWAGAAGCDYGYFAANTPFPGAADFEQAVREDLIVDWNWEHYDTWYPVRRFRHISARQMYDGVRRAFREFYGGSAIGRRLWAAMSELRGLALMPQRLRRMVLGAVVGRAIGAAETTQWRLDMPYEEYESRVDRTPNPHVLAQFAEGKPAGQFDAHLRMAELSGGLASRTVGILGEGIPITVVDDEPALQEVRCASS